MTSEELAAAQLIWDFHLLHQPLKKADCIFVLGSNDLRVPAYAADLYLQGYAPWLVISGHKGHLTDKWKNSEADVFAEVAKQKGVPTKAIILETEARNTGENIQFTRKKLETLFPHFQTFLLVQKPYMERRALLTFEKHWPGKNGIVSSPPISMVDWATPEIPLAKLVSSIVGDFQRLLIYPDRGFHASVVIPENILNAYTFLLAQGFTSHLISPHE